MARLVGGGGDAAYWACGANLVALANEGRYLLREGERGRGGEVRGSEEKRKREEKKERKEGAA